MSFSVKHGKKKVDSKTLLYQEMREEMLNSCNCRDCFSKRYRWISRKQTCLHFLCTTRWRCEHPRREKVVHRIRVCVRMQVLCSKCAPDLPDGLCSSFARIVSLYLCFCMSLSLCARFSYYSPLLIRFLVIK